MRIDWLVNKLTELQKLYPKAIVYFTDEVCDETFETYFEGFFVDEESNEIEMKFNQNNFKWRIK